MNTLTLQSRIEDDGHLRLDIPTGLPSGEVDLVVVIRQRTAHTSRSEQKYDFSDLSGRLQWQGDATATQRSLRDEWT